MSKAINTDLHKCLCYRLFYYGIHGITLMWTRNVSSDGAQKYILNGQPSNSTNVISGIPQGLVFGLFYLSDMPVSHNNELFGMGHNEIKMS